MWGSLEKDEATRILKQCQQDPIPSSVLEKAQEYMCECDAQSKACFFSMFRDMNQVSHQLFHLVAHCLLAISLDTLEPGKEQHALGRDFFMGVQEPPQHNALPRWKYKKALELGLVLERLRDTDFCQHCLYYTRDKQHHEKCPNNTYSMMHLWY
jgi:hypothetical protein